MVDYGLDDKVVLITGANNPQGIGATAALAFAREGAKVILVYKRIARAFDENKTGRNGVDRYYAANAGNADIVEGKLRAMNADFLLLERDVSDENAVREIFSAVIGRYGKVDVLVNNAADCDCDGVDTIEKGPSYSDKDLKKIFAAIDESVSDAKQRFKEAPVGTKDLFKRQSKTRSQKQTETML